MSGAFYLEKEPSFFDFAAEVGLTKHIGGIEATETLASLCHVDADSYVLDVGCGVGATPCFLARRYRCRVVGVDILPAMVERSRERACREGVTDQLEFKVADAQALPFDDNQFDAVITESVTAFPGEKQQAVNEYARVTKVGGYVGLNESVWLKEPVPPDVAAWAAQEVGATVKPLLPAGWVELLVVAGLTDRYSETYPVDTKVEAKGLVRRYGLGGMLGVTWRMLGLYVGSPANRQFVARVRQGGIVPEYLADYFGYGLFVGRKQP